MPWQVWAPKLSQLYGCRLAGCSQAAAARRLPAASRAGCGVQLPAGAHFVSIKFPAVKSPLVELAPVYSCLRVHNSSGLKSRAPDVSKSLLPPRAAVMCAESCPSSAQLTRSSRLINCKLQTVPAHQKGSHAADVGPHRQVVQEARPPQTEDRHPSLPANDAVCVPFFEQAIVASPHQPLRLDPLPPCSSSSQVPKIACDCIHSSKRSPDILMWLSAVWAL